MAIRGIIFDLDGTLLDTLGDLVNAANATLAQYGFPGHSAAAYRYFVGDGLMTLMERIVPAGNRSPLEIAACMDTFLQIYGKSWDLQSRPYPGIMEMLQQLQAAGLKLGVLSNKPHSFTQLCVNRFFPEDTFDFVFGHREIVPKKPDPAGALEIAALMEIPPAHILYVGDTATDMQTGNKAGMFTIGVLWGFRERLELAENKAGKIISHPSEIVDHAINKC